MKRAVRWAVVSVGLAGLITAVTLAPSGATPPSGLTNIPLARGSNTSDGTIPLKAGTDVALAQITVSPGGSSGRDRGRPAGLAHGVRIGRRPVRDRSVQCGSGVRRATWRSGSSHQHGHGPVYPVRHLPTCASGCVRENRRAGPGHVSRSLDDLTEPSRTHSLASRASHRMSGARLCEQA